jgi:hypothetical protein
LLGRPVRNAVLWPGALVADAPFHLADKNKKFKWINISAYGCSDPNASTCALTTVSQQNVALPRIDDEDVMVWMRSAGLSTFRKLYRKVSP